MSWRSFVKTDRCLFPIVLCTAVFASDARAHGVHEYVNGHWYDGSSFTERDFFVVEGVLQTSYDGEAEEVDLEGAFVLPGYGNAHTHGIGNDNYQKESELFLERGVFYVANPNSLRSRSSAAREELGSSESVDAQFSNGGLTSTGGHPIQIFEGSAESSAMDGDAYFIVDDLAQLESRWSEILEGKPDFLKVYLEESEHHDSRKNDPDFYGKRGLDPELIAPIVERAHAAGLRVAAHVTSRLDFRVAVDAGVDQIAHLPLEELEKEDALAAVEQNVVVVTTVLSHRPSERVADLEALHRSNLTMLRGAGVSMILGTDSQATILDEVNKIDSLGVLERAELVDMLVRATPQWIFPERPIGVLEAGKDASFVTLEANPLEDLAALSAVQARVKRGHLLEIEETASDEMAGIGQHLVHFIMGRGIDAAIAEYHRAREEEADTFDFSEGQLNALGYAMMQHGKHAEAMEIFLLNAEQYPASANVWDSIAESYAERGETALAIENYEKALEINPANEETEAKLQELRGQL